MEEGDEPKCSPVGIQIKEIVRYFNQFLSWNVSGVEEGCSGNWVMATGNKVFYSIIFATDFPENRSEPSDADDIKKLS